MVATRVMMTMAVLAIGGGAFLAASTIPAMAPYQERKPGRVAPLIALPQSEPSTDVPQAPAYRLALPSQQESSDGDFHLDTRDGALVLEVPHWIEDGGAWVTLGRRAWRDLVEEDDSDYRDDEQGYATRPRHDRDDRSYYRYDGYAPAPARRWRDDDEESYTDQDRWSEPVEQPLPRFAPYAEDAPVANDAAARAAARAREAAGDVRAAEGAVQ
jgi:hypothetical protein